MLREECKTQQVIFFFKFWYIIEHITMVLAPYIYLCREIDDLQASLNHLNSETRDNSNIDVTKVLFKINLRPGLISVYFLSMIFVLVIINYNYKEICTDNNLGNLILLQV